MNNEYSYNNKLRRKWQIQNQKILKRKKSVRIRNNQEYYYIEPFLAGRTYLNNLEYMKELAG